MLFYAISHNFGMCSPIGSHELSGEILIEIDVLIFQTSFAMVLMYSLPPFALGFLRPYLTVMKHSSPSVYNPDSSSLLFVFGVDCEACCVTPRQYETMGLYQATPSLMTS